jgi:hypothetical protein
MQPNDVLDYWFGDAANTKTEDLKDYFQRWFQGGRELDKEIKTKFGKAVKQTAGKPKGSDSIENGKSTWTSYKICFQSSLTLLVFESVYPPHMGVLYRLCLTYCYALAPAIACT